MLAFIIETLFHLMIFGFVVFRKFHNIPIVFFYLVFIPFIIGRILIDTGTMDLILPERKDFTFLEKTEYIFRGIALIEILKRF